MKRTVAVFLSLLACLVLTVPVYALERYVPKLPPFYAGGQITVPYDREATPQVKSFFDTLKDGPYVTLIVQQATYNEANADDLSWNLVFVKLPSSTTNRSFGSFVYYDPLNYFSYRSSPIQLGWNGHDYFDTVTYKYDYEEQVLNYRYFAQFNKVFFSYLIDSSPLSNKADFYPGYRTLAGKYDFITQPANPQDTLKRHYNWWLASEFGGDLEPPKEPEVNVDTDGDGKPDINVDTNGDGKPDVNVDTNGDKRPDLNIDTDGDGKPDINLDTDGDGKPDVNVDTNGDKRPDLNIDTNGDKKPDVNVDTDGDGKPNINIDTDGDRKPDLNIDTNGDKKPDVNVDTTGNGKPDLNVDTDGDGKPDRDIDTDGDGKPDKNVSGGGSGGGSSGGGSSSGGSGGTPSRPWWETPDFGSDWFPDDPQEDLYYRDFPIFNPFDYEYDPPHYDDPYNDYNPLDGWEIPNKLPEVPRPSDPGYNFRNPFPFEWTPGI